MLGRVWREASGDQIPMVAASCGFYALLALFPGISFLISLYGLLLDPVRVERQLQAVRDVVPAEAFDLIAAQVHKLAAAGSTKLTWGLALSLLVALWSCMSGTKALLTSLNIAYEEQEKRSFLRYNLQALLFTLGGVLGVTLALAIIVGVPAVLNLTWLGTGEALAVRVISFLLLLGFVMLGLAVLYRFGPSREEPRWHWVTPGSVAAAIVWVVASLLFSFYVGTLGSYDATYGPLGAVVVMLMWFWIGLRRPARGRAQRRARAADQARHHHRPGPADGRAGCLRRRPRGDRLTLERPVSPPGQSPAPFGHLSGTFPDRDRSGFVDDARARGESRAGAASGDNGRTVTPRARAGAGRWWEEE